jgi:hypothetical protein
LINEYTLKALIMDEKFISYFIQFLKENFKDEVKEENIIIGKKTIFIDTTLMDPIHNIFRFEERSDNMELFNYCGPLFEEIYNYYLEGKQEWYMLYHI